MSHSVVLPPQSKFLVKKADFLTSIQRESELDPLMEATLFSRSLITPEHQI